VRFVGNDVAVVDESLPLVAMLADALGRHAGICARLEGHANSRCGLDCDGSSDCANAKCRKLFGSRGGAVGFSYRRANAVVEHLVAAGVDGASVSAAGLAGSRRIVDDPEAADNYRNRRVEIHCA
jgi:outer membrane protein OmpA-like peptidoglycan-associated protein